MKLAIKFDFLFLTLSWTLATLSFKICKISHFHKKEEEPKMLNLTFYKIFVKIYIIYYRT